MPAGWPYFAWIDPTETTFTSAHMRWDEQVFSFKLSEVEGDPASLTTIVRRPRNAAGDPIGLLGPGRKIWAWFALDCGPALVKFRGRLVGVPTSIFEDLVTLEFVAKPIDLVAQKDALANSLRVLPFYDDVVIDPARRTDPDLVLEGYTKIWHYDRETHVITVSDEITGEDGTVSFDGASDDGKVLYDGLGLTLTSGPLSRVDVTAEYTWTQLADGTVDLTPSLTTGGVISSYSLEASDWPKAGTSIGNGWEVSSSSARNVSDLTVRTVTDSGSLTVESPDGSVNRSTFNTSSSYCATRGIPLPLIINQDSWQANYSTDDDGLLYCSSFTRSYSSTQGFLALQVIEPTLQAGYKAERPCKEIVTITLFADVQHILTDPTDGEALRIDNIRSVNLSDGPSPPIGDPRRRSYIATARGNESIKYLILLARAHLMKRARVVEIAFAPKLSRMPEITLRKSAFLADPRIGQAVGKIIGYSLALDGSDGRIKCEVRIGCPIGYGGLVTAVVGTPTYCDIAYTGSDYQQFIDRTVLIDNSVGYGPPNSAPDDDGIEFLAGALNISNAFDQPVAIEFGSDEQESIITSAPPVPSGGIYTTSLSGDFSEDMLAARAQYVQNLLDQHETRITFKLKSMNRAFSTNYAINTTHLQIPTGYDLEAT